MDIERSTSKNMTEHDKLLLIELVEENKSVLECKKTDSISNRKKSETWTKVRISYNSRRVGGPEKSEAQLKTAFKNIKGKFRKDLAAEKMETFKTGGGSSSTKLEDNPVYSIVSKSVTPNKNPYDSSADYFADTEEQERVDSFHVEFLDENYDDSVEDDEGHNNSDDVINMTSSTSLQNTITNRQSKFPPARKRPAPRTTETESEKRLKEAQIEALASKKQLNDIKSEYYKKKIEQMSPQVS